MRQNIYLSKKLKDDFALYCKAKGWKVSTVVQKMMELIMTGFDPFNEEKETKEHGNITPTSN